MEALLTSANLTRPRSACILEVAHQETISKRGGLAAVFQQENARSQAPQAVLLGS